MSSKRYPQDILVSCEIPWSDNETLLEDIFRKEIQTSINNGFTNMYIFGTASEGYAVTNKQFKQIAEIFWEETKLNANIKTMVGTIGMSTVQVVERITIAYDIGFRMFQIPLPPWGTLNDNEYMTFFKDVCGNFSDCNFLHYNLLRSGRILLTEDYKRIQESVPNLVATKFTNASPSECYKLITQTDLQHFLGEENFAFGSLHGECSLLSSFAAIAPNKIKNYFNYGKEKNYKDLFKLQLEISLAIKSFLNSAFKFKTMDGAYDKMFKKAAGIDMPLKLLSPYETIPLDVYNQSLKNLQSEYGEWLAT